MSLIRPPARRRTRTRAPNCEAHANRREPPFTARAWRCVGTQIPQHRLTFDVARDRQLVDVAQSLDIRQLMASADTHAPDPPGVGVDGCPPCGLVRPTADRRWACQRELATGQFHRTRLVLLKLVDRHGAGRPRRSPAELTALLHGRGLTARARRRRRIVCSCLRVLGRPDTRKRWPGRPPAPCAAGPDRPAAARSAAALEDVKKILTNWPRSTRGSGGACRRHVASAREPDGEAKRPISSLKWPGVQSNDCAGNGKHSLLVFAYTEWGIRSSGELRAPGSRDAG